MCRKKKGIREMLAINPINLNQSFGKGLVRTGNLRTTAIKFLSEPVIPEPPKVFSGLELVDLRNFWSKTFTGTLGNELDLSEVGKGYIPKHAKVEMLSPDEIRDFALFEDLAMEAKRADEVDDEVAKLLKIGKYAEPQPGSTKEVLSADDIADLVKMQGKVFKPNNSDAELDKELADLLADLGQIR